MAEILDRLHTSAEQWHARLDRLRTGRPLGRFFAATRARLREIGTRLNLKHVPNLGGWHLARGRLGVRGIPLPRPSSELIEG